MSTGCSKFVSAESVCYHREEGAASMGSCRYPRASRPSLRSLPPRGLGSLPLFFFFNLLNRTVFTKRKVIEVQEVEANENPFYLHFTNRHRAAKQGWKCLVVRHALKQQLLVWRRTSQVQHRVNPTPRDPWRSW